MKTPARLPKTSLLRTPALRSFTLIEMTIAMVILSVMAGMVAFAAASMDHSLVLMDLNSAMNDELSRQAEIAKNTNFDAFFGVGLPPVAPIGTSTTINISADNVNQLQGFLPVTSGGSVAKPAITWTLYRTNFISDIGHKALMDRVTITATFQISGFPLLTNATTIIKVFDANQQ
jgi:prepilin-type N-terminal cleavage/methylation domain-containing protein